MVPSPPLPSPPPLTHPDHTTYRYTPHETGVLTIEPYKSALLPLWRFKTPTLAQTSSSAIYAAFIAYEQDADFIGMDMARKFLQMGMTRAKRYANHKGGRKYKEGEGGREVIVVKEGETWKGREEKEEASRVFREVWERARTYTPYLEMKGEFLKRQREWEREGKGKEKGEGKVVGNREKSRGKRRKAVKEGVDDG